MDELGELAIGLIIVVSLFGIVVPFLPGLAMEVVAVVVEVESPGTVRHDRGVKFDRYRELPSVRETLLVASIERRIQLWRRQGERWTVEDVIGDAPLRLESCALEIPLADLYAGF